MRPHTPVLLAAALLIAAGASGPTRRATWGDLPAAIQRHLTARGIRASDLPSALERIERESAGRLRDGDWEALVYYALQARGFTSLPVIEPALSARSRHETRGVPRDAHARLDTLADLLQRKGEPADARVAYFRRLVADDARVASQGVDRVLRAEYERVMAFLYDKEFGAAREKLKDPAHAGGSLYQHRGYSTDTGVEAGYAVHQALGVIKALNPSVRIRRVLIVGPGLTLASRTGFVEEVSPQSYQPYAVLDDLLSLGLSTGSEVRIDCVDISPRVVSHIERQRTAEGAPLLELLSIVPDRAAAPLTPDYRSYLDRWGRAVGAPVQASTLPHRLAAHLHRSIRLSSAARARVHAARANIIVDRWGGPSYDLVIATNVLTYFDDVELLLGVGNVVAMLRAEGHFVHNETREALIEVADQVGLPIVHTRTVVFNQPSSEAAPLHDRVWIHRRDTNDNRRARRPAAGPEGPALRALAMSPRDRRSTARGLWQVSVARHR